VTVLRDLNTFWFIPQLLTSLGFLLAMLLFAHLLRSQRSTSSTIAWLLVIVFLPYVGVPLYLMFGGRKMRRRAGRKAQVYHRLHRRHERSVAGPAEMVLGSYGLPPPIAGNRVATVTSGEEAYRVLLELLESATETIHITTYILGRDSVGRSILDCLARRAAAGVRVRVLLDDVGSWRVSRRFIAPLVEAGASVAFFMPMIHLPFRGRTNLRNHRKIVVVDGVHALTGGMNLAREYMGPTPDPRRWRDFSAVLNGPAVADLEELFRSDWKFATGEDLDAEPAPPESAPTPVPTPAPTPVHAPGAVVQVVASGPDVAGDPLYATLVSVIFAARQRIWVVTPYFIPDETLARALDLAARRGVDLRLVLPARSNHLMADLARASYIRQVHDAGGRILLYEPGMVHAKVVVVDDRLAIVGSANMDMRSLFLNYEVALFIYTPEKVEETAEWVRCLMTECVSQLPVHNQAHVLAENVVRLLSPLL
jgi:cardiolipin synthase